MKKVESDRDRLLERLLPAALHVPNTAAPPDGCVDAETAAAWADDALDKRERAIVETHAASCSRCQALLGALVRTNPPAPAIAWFRRSMLAWAAPLTAAAAALIVWTMLPPRSGIVPVERTASVDAVAVAPPPSSPSAQAAPNQPLASTAAEPARRARPDDQKQERREAAPLVTPAPAPSAANKAAAPAPPPAASASAAAAAPLRSAAAQASADQPASSPAAAGAAAPASGRALAESMFAARVTAIPPPALIVSTNPSYRWRIGTSGVVQHSSDGGSTWETQQTGASVTLTAGASPSSSICWLVGPGGIVLLSTDGRSWRELPFKEKVDLVSVRATDERTASVTAAGDRTFTTIDGGLTWMPR